MNDERDTIDAWWHALETDQRWIRHNELLADEGQVHEHLQLPPGNIQGHGRDRRTGISKGRNNQQQGFKFRGTHDVYNAMSPLLASAGLCVLPRVTSRQVTERQAKSGGVLFNVALDVEFDLCCAEDGSKHSIAVSGEAMDSGDKATNKAMSAAFKYACMQVLCIPTEGNPDADSETHEVVPQTAQVQEIYVAARVGNPLIQSRHFLMLFR